MLQSCLESLLSQTVPFAGVTVLCWFSQPQRSLARNVLRVVGGAGPGGVPGPSAPRACGLAGTAVPSAGAVGGAAGLSPEAVQSAVGRAELLM